MRKDLLIRAIARTKALAVLNDTVANDTHAVAEPRPATTTLAAFLTDDYSPTAGTHLKRRGKAQAQAQVIASEGRSTR